VSDEETGEIVSSIIWARMKKGRMKIRTVLLAALGICCLGASRPNMAEVEPYFGENYEKAQVIARGFDQTYHEGIMITGTSGYISRTREALELIEGRDPRNWYFVRKHVRRITLSGHPGMDIGGGRLTTGREEGATAEAIAGGIVHEAWHRELYLTGSLWDGREAEIFCLKKQNEALDKLDGVQLDMDEALRSEYWKVDYWSRDW